MSPPKYLFTYGTATANNATVATNSYPAAPPIPEKEKTPLEWLDEKVEKVVTRAGF